MDCIFFGDKTFEDRVVFFLAMGLLNAFLLHCFLMKSPLHESLKNVIGYCLDGMSRHVGQIFNDLVAFVCTYTLKQIHQ